MRALEKKLVRDIWRLRGQVISIALVVACGVSTVVVFRSALDSLEASRDSYYESSRFADVFVAVKRAPETILARIEGIQGVSSVETRISLRVTLDVPGLDEPATGQLVSLPIASGINSLYLRRGRLPASGHPGEVVLGEQFALANRLALGDTLSAVINGRWKRLSVVGIGLSPEYVYSAQPGLLFTDDRRFGVLWMDHEQLAAANGMSGAFNDLVVELAPGASEESVIMGLDRVLDRFGSLGAYGRDEQISDRVITNEIRQNRIFAVLMPAIFLLVAAFLLSVVLHRLVNTDREEIAVLKAFGYGDLTVGYHYLRFALVAVLLGSALGIGVGLWLGRGLMGLYAQTLRFPELTYQVSWGMVVAAIAMSGVAASLGAMGAVRSAVTLPPAEAMRPEAPARFSHGWVESLLPHGITPIGHIIVRNLTRRPLRTLNAVLGFALAMSILVGMLCFFDAFSYVMDVQFRSGQRQDLTVAFNSPRADAVRYDLERLPGVHRVELFRSVPIRIRSEWRSRQILLTGLTNDAQLRRVVDDQRQPHTVPAEGVMLGSSLARLLEVSVGDTVQLEVLDGARPVLRLPVSATVSELFGTEAYIEYRLLSRLLREAPLASGANLSVGGSSLAALNLRLKETPQVGGVSSPRSMLRSFEDEMARSLNVNLWITSIFAGIIALGVVYNGARIALSERGRELASLRVLGFSIHEVAVILLGEQAVLTGLGIPLGYGLGIAIFAGLAEALGSELYRIPLVLYPRTFVISAGVTTAAAVIAALVVRRRLAHLDMIAVLKTRE